MYAWGPDLKEYQPPYISPDDTRMILAEARERFGELPDASEPAILEAPYEKEITHEDMIVKWINERCIKNPEARTDIRDLHNDYNNWVDGEQISKLKFAMELTRLNYERGESNGVRYRYGIALIDQVESRKVPEYVIAGVDELE